MSAVRLRGVSLLAVLVLNALVLLTWSQVWLDARAQGQRIPVSGSVSAGAVLPLTLSGLALLAALAIAGPVFRIVLGILQAALGLSVAIVAGMVIGNPAAAAAPRVAVTTGLTGVGTAISASPTAWPAATLTLAALLILTGIGIAATASRWPGTTNRFERSRLAAEEAGREPTDDPIRDWDALSEGEDPTTGSR